MQTRISRKVKQGKVDVDYNESALVVHYDVETVEVDEMGNIVEVLERKPEIRRILIRSFSPDKNVAQLAVDIVDKCKYIHPSRTEEIEQLLIKLRKHRLDNPNIVDEPNDTNTNNKSGGTGGRDVRDGKEGRDGRDQRGSERVKDSRDGRDDREGGNRERAAAVKPPPPVIKADMEQLDEYLDMLYQVAGKSEKEQEKALKAQERGTLLILQLCRDVMNLEQLIQNSTVMGAITRVFQEEFKKSIDLTFNILRIFLAFSNFLEMHSLMANYRIGVLTLKAAEFEMKRAEVREQEKVQREQQFLDDLRRQQLEQGVKSTAGIQEKLAKFREKEAAKNQQFTRKQDKLLFVAMYVLLNLAEDISIEKKMVKKSLLQYLLTILQTRHFEDLLILAVTFLKKLSMFEENKEMFKSSNIIEQVGKMVPCSSTPLTTISLRFLFNLSFDKDLREQMLKAGLVPKLVQLLKTPSYRAKTLKLLYHLSVDDRCKSMLSYTEGVAILTGLVINFPGEKLAKELAALVVNLSYHAKNIEAMLANKGLNLLVDRFADKRDVLVMKVIRNISLFTFNTQQQLQQQVFSTINSSNAASSGGQDNSSDITYNYKYRGLWSPHVRSLIEIMRDEESNHDMVIEVMGCLANMTAYDLPATSNWSRLLKDFQLVPFACKFLASSSAQNDLLLEIVMFIGTVATDNNACSLLASSSNSNNKLIVSLYGLFEEKGEDVEILLQLLNCFHKLMYNKESREAVLYNTRIFANIIDCLDHSNAAVRAKAHDMSEMVLEYDRKPDGALGRLGQQILKRRFVSYNKQWLSGVNLPINLMSDGSTSSNVNANNVSGMSSKAVAEFASISNDHDNDHDEDANINNNSFLDNNNYYMQQHQRMLADTKFNGNGNGDAYNNSYLQEEAIDRLQGQNDFYNNNASYVQYNTAGMSDGKYSEPDQRYGGYK